MKNPFYKLLLMSALLLGATSCSEDDTESASSFSITAPTSENYQLSVAKSAKAGDEVSLTILPAEGLEVASVLYNENPCTLILSDPENHAATYSFTMPACDVTLTIDVREMGPSEYTIQYNNTDSYYYSDVPSTATAGNEVTFTITVTDLSMYVPQVAFGPEEDEICLPSGEVTVTNDYKRYSFQFTMPDHDVTLVAAMAVEYNDITRIGDEHAKVRLVNSIIKDENGDPLTDENGEYICRNYLGQLVKFVYEIDLGYNYEMTIVGDRTNTHYENKIYFSDSDFDAGQCWILEMPAEPITFTIKSTEKTDFVGKPFVGNYSGFFINTTEIGKLEKANTPNLSVELKTNTVFEFKSTDVNNFNFRGMMSYDESDNQFEYLRESCDGYGLSGYWNEKMTLAWVTNIIEDMPEHTRFYIMSKEELSDFISAGNAGGTKYLLEVRSSAGMNYYLFERENYRLREVEVDFINGSSLGDASASGYVVENGVKLLKYTSEGSATNLVEKGKEAGSYQPQSGTGDVLELDGFGGGKIGSQEGTYTIADGIVTLNCSGNETKYNIDMNAKTYTVIADEGVWNGPTTFYAEGSTLSYNGKKNTQGNVKILINPETTKATIIAQYYSDMYRMEDAINTTVSYVYDANASTLTLSQVLMGDETGAAWYKRVDIVLSVSDDKQTLTFTGIDRLYATNNPNIYVTVTNLAVPAQQ